MDIFTQKRATTWTIIVLVVINLVALGTILWHVTRKPHAPPPPQKRGPDQTQYFLRNELDLSEQQAQRFEELGRYHREESVRILDDIYRLKAEMMIELFHEEPDLGRVENLAEKIGSKEAEKEMLLFNHFLDLAEVCEPEQREKFNTIIHELLKMLKLLMLFSHLIPRHQWVIGSNDQKKPLKIFQSFWLIKI